MRARLLFGNLAVLLLASLPARADTPKPVEPTVIVRLKSLDGLFADVKYLAELAGQADKAREIEGVVQSLAGARGLAGTGIDTKRPSAVYALVGPAGIDSKVVVMLPIADETAFVDTLNTLLGHASVSLNKGPDGVYSVAIPNTPIEAYLRFANKYAYIAAPDRTAIEPNNLLPPTAQGLKAADGEMLGLTVNIDRIPDSLKQIALSQMQVQIANAKEKKQPNETAIQSKLKVQILDHVFQQIKTIFTDGGALEARLGIDRKAEDVSLQATLNGKPGSALARDLAAIATRSSIFGTLKADALHVAANLALPDDLRSALAAFVDGEIAQALAKEQDPTKKEVAQKLFAVLAPTLKAGVLDATVGANGPDAAGHYVAFAALNVQDGKAIEKVVKELAGKVPEKDRAALKLDAETVNGVAIHIVNPGNTIDAEARRLFGDQMQAYVAFRPDAVLLVLGGPSAPSTMKALIAAAPAKSSAAIQVHAAIARLAALDKDKGPQMKKAADQVFGKDPRGRDVIQFKVDGGGALQVRFTVTSDIIKFLSRLNENAEK